MARIRTIKPEFWTSPDVARLSRDARLLFIGTWTVADDHGYLEDDPERLLLQLYPGDRELSGDDVAEWITELVGRGMVKRLNDDEGRRLLQVVAFGRHQKIDRPSRSRYAVPEAGPRPAKLLPDPPPEVQPEAEREAEAEAEPAPAKAKRQRKAKPDPDKLPDDFPERLEPFVEPVKAILREIGESNGARSVIVPSTRAVGMALADFEFRDFLRVAKDYRAWQLGDRCRTPHRDPVRGYRSQLDRAPDVLRPELPGAAPGGGESEAERTARRLAELEE